VEVRTDGTRRPERGNLVIGKEKWQILYGDDKITDRLEQQIREIAHFEPIRNYWAKKELIQYNTFEVVNWTAIERAMKQSTTQTKHWIIKRAARNCGANAVLCQRRQRKDDKCPFCGESETVMHVY
jgi:actin-related protein